MNRILAILCFGLLSAVASPSSGAVVLSSNFDDGTLQGWSPEEPFGGTLFVEIDGGNPDGFMSASDNAGGGRLLVRAPNISGDLNDLASISWDEYVFNIPSTIKSTNIFVKGIDGTIWESDRAFLSFETWITKTARFAVPSDWTLVSGTSSFEAVMGNAAGVFINMGTTTLVVGQESGVDNIVINSFPPVAVQQLTWSTVKSIYH